MPIEPQELTVRFKNVTVSAEKADAFQDALDDLLDEFFGGGNWVYEFTFAEDEEEEEES